METLQETPEPQTNEQPAPPVDPVTQPANNTPPQFSGKPQDFEKDMALLAQQQGMTVAPPEAPALNPEPQTGQPDQPQAQEPQPVEVPDKFKKPDGSVDTDKLDKSTQNLAEKLAKFRQMERDFTQQSQKAKPPVQPVQSVSEAISEVPKTFEEQIEADLKKEGAGKVLAKLFAAAKEAAKAEALTDVNDLRQQAELDRRQREVERIAQVDPWVLSEQGMNTLFKIRQDKPWLNGAPSPMEAAYREYVADQALTQRRGSQVSMPNPRGVTAPVVPATPVNRAPSQPAPKVDSMSKDQIDAHLSGKSQAEVAAFFKSFGLPLTTRPGRK